MLDTDFFDLLLAHLEERSFHNVREYLMQNEDYQDASKKENELYMDYQNLNLSKEQCQTVERLIDAITAQNAAQTSIVFRMGMQCCFSLLVQLADLK